MLFAATVSFLLIISLLLNTGSPGFLSGVFGMKLLKHSEFSISAALAVDDKDLILMVSGSGPRNSLLSRDAGFLESGLARDFFILLDSPWINPTTPSRDLSKSCDVSTSLTSAWINQGFGLSQKMYFISADSERWYN